ncbi:MAG TPA: hypothetical protein VM938_06070 [Acidimicrobiales bacterium]|nr:hypothetical protein [Acidimicrobiales bacterium]
MADDRTPAPTHRAAAERLHDDLLNELTPAEWRLVVSLVEALATSDEAECPVCRRQIDRVSLAEHLASCRDSSVTRTRRLEVVDANGRVRLLVGQLDHPPAPSTVGLALLDETGHERAVLSLEPEGPQLELTSQGHNTAVLLGVADPGGEVDANTYLVLFDHEATPAAAWRVNAAGKLLVFAASTETSGT